MLATASFATVIGLAMAGPAQAHPLGNFTINTSAAMRIAPDEVLIDYLIDEAEIPTVQARSAIDSDGDDDLSTEEQSRYADTMCRSAASNLQLVVDGRAVPLDVSESDVTFPKGQAGLDTMRIDCRLRGGTDGSGTSSTVRLTDENFSDLIGWREIIAVGDRTTITQTDVAEESTSKRLASYPEGQINSPLDQRSATVTVKPGGSAAADPGVGSGSPIPLPSADRLANLLGERALTIPFALFAVTVSFVLGGFHALAPGHGKTVMAAYLVGQRGARRQALILGATVAFTHTGGVMALALVATNSSIAPERFYPVLGTISGLLVVGIGLVLLRRALQFRKLLPTLGPGASLHHHHGIGGHTHSHDDENHDHSHSHSHSHDDHEDHGHLPSPVGAPVGVAERGGGAGDNHSHPHLAEVDVPGAGATAGAGTLPLSTAPAMNMRGMMAMGFAGGLVPSPSALVVLLGAIAIGQAWFGFLLIIAYGAGLAAVLVGAGLLIERLRSRIEPFLTRRKHSPLTGLAMNLPVVTAVLVVLGGGYLVARALITG